MKSTEPLRILHLEDEPGFCELVKTFLAHEGLDTEISVVGDLDQLAAALEHDRFDAILADYHLPTCTGLEAMETAARRSHSTPFILISGALDEHSAVQAIRSGATDCVFKPQIQRLAPVLRRAVSGARQQAELARTKAQLNAPDGYLQALTENSLDAVTVLSAEGLFRYASPSARHVLTYEPEELLRLSAFSFVHPDDLAEAQAALRRALADPGLRVTHELRFRRRDGSYSDLEIVGQSHIANPQVAGVVLNTRDITQRKAAAAKLRLQSLALESASNAIVITDRGGTVLWTNPAFSRLTGYSEQEVRGNTLRVLKSGKQDEAFYEGLWKTISAGKVWRSEVVNRHKDGHLFTEEMTITPVLDAQGQITHFIAVKQDISKRKKAEEELHETHHRLLDASRQAAIAEFATSILHNVGNVLNSVGVASSCLAQNLRQSHGARLGQVVDLIAQNQDHLGEFFTQHPKGKLVPSYLAQLAEKLRGEQAEALREIERLQRNLEHIKAIITLQQSSAKSSGTTERLLPSELVQEALSMHSNTLARANIDLHTDFAEIPPVLLRKHLVLQILVNLIRNAVESCQAASGPRQILVKTHAAGQRLQLTITDNGIGIAPENLSRLFQLGFTTKPDGHGFGLHSCVAAAKEMGGALSVHSAGPGLGATFTLELPMEDPSADLNPRTPAANDLVRA